MSLRDRIAAGGASVQRGRAVRYCTRCITPDTRPRIVFDDNGVCNACLNAERKQSIDWSARKAELQRLLEGARRADGGWDCVTPWSGGKDSSAIAYRLKHEYGMNPLLITFSPLLPNRVGELNREALIQAGFDHLQLRADQRVHRHLARRFFVERGNPKVAWDAGINAVPVRMAVSLGIPLVFYAEHGESEYGGRVLSEESQKIRDITEVIEHQVGDDPRNWVDREVSLRDLNPYIYPSSADIEQVGLRAMYFAWFHKWNMAANYRFIADVIPFATHPAGRTCGTFTDFDSLDDKIDDLYYYMQYVKFGFGRAIRDASRLIQNNEITREQGLEYARLYDGEFPAEHLDEVLDYLRMDREEFDRVVDLHRNKELWEQDADGAWKLRYPPL